MIWFEIHLVCDTYFLRKSSHGSAVCVSVTPSASDTDGSDTDRSGEKNNNKVKKNSQVEPELKKSVKKVVLLKAVGKVLEDLKRCHITEKTEVQEVVTH